MRILAFVDYYLPGSKGGGPAVSVSRRAASMAGRCEFLVFTRDRDLGDSVPYPNVLRDSWRDGVFYASPRSRGILAILRCIKDAKPDVIYLNSLFSQFSRRVLLLRWLGWLRGVRVVVAPRGECDRGALSLKARKKRAYLRFTRAIGLYSGLVWHATSLQEKSAIERVFPQADVRVASEAGPEVFAHSSAEKARGNCRFVFLSRVSRKKNLAFMAEVLGKVDGDIELHVYGPIEDERYWEETQAAFRELAPDVALTYHGSVANGDVPQVLADHHFFVLPTLGENHCHAIAEALACGVPCLISNKTPWNDTMRNGAGWAIPLTDMEAWIEQAQACVAMDQDELSALRASAQAAYAAWSPSEGDFESVLAA
jgi:glycosyltransferase involved in cell wall biosynthesis